MRSMLNRSSARRSQPLLGPAAQSRPSVKSTCSRRWSGHRWQPLVTGSHSLDAPGPSHSVDCGRRDVLLSSAALGLWQTTEPAQASEAPAAVELEDLSDDDSGFVVKIPKGWELERPGGRYEFHAPKDYGGKRIIIKKEFLGKSKTLDLRLLGDLNTYAETLVYNEGVGAKTGTNAVVLSTSEAGDGRFYYVEYRINSFQPQHVWSVAGAGLGESPGARKFRNRQLITVTGKMSEEELAKDPEGGKLLQDLISTFAFTDKPLAEF